MGYDNRDIVDGLLLAVFGSTGLPIDMNTEKTSSIFHFRFWLCAGIRALQGQSRESMLW